MMWPGVAAANEDVELLQPPSDKGDPDVPDGVAQRFGFGGWARYRIAASRLLSSLRLAGNQSSIRVPTPRPASAGKTSFRRK